MPEPTSERFAALFRNARGWKSALAAALGYYHGSSMARAMEQPTQTLLAVLELLEAMPRKRWPDRFKELAALADAKEKKEGETT